MQPQSLFKQSTDLGNLGKQSWSWHCMKLMCKIKGYNKSMNPIPSELHNIIHTIANEDWQSQLNKPLDPSSESRGKLVIYRKLQQGPLPPSYVLANLTMKRHRTMAAIHGGCLPLAIERGRFMYQRYL